MTTAILKATASYRVEEFPLAALSGLKRSSAGELRWDCLFTTPAWLETWWRCFGAGRAVRLVAAYRKDALIGMAPLMELGNGTAVFIGDPEICDYQDIVAGPGKAAVFMELLVEHALRLGIDRFDLRDVKSDSLTVSGLTALSAAGRLSVEIEPVNVALSAALPENWEAYLMGLSGKERHEVRRKLRRLHTAGAVRFRLAKAAGEVREAVETFLDLFTRNRADKADFMTEAMADFFRQLAQAAATAGMLRMYQLDIDGVPASSVMCFDYGDTRYLYNNAYDERFSALSVGLAGKLLSLREAVRERKGRYHFLKGGEAYKRRLGGRSETLFRCRAVLG
jgi:CelD/BcsL family acetyltransferase involved in cellulose biosynthesis